MRRARHGQANISSSGQHPHPSIQSRRTSASTLPAPTDCGPGLGSHTSHFLFWTEKTVSLLLEPDL